MATLASQIVEDLRGLAGLKKVTEAEALRLVNEGHRELCVRSEWTRATLELGPTVAEQAAYAVPATADRFFWVKLDGLDLLPADEITVARIIAGDYRLVSRPVWWLTEDDAGVQSVSVYPTPDMAGQPLLASVVVSPADLVAANPVKVPDRSVRGIRSYAASVIYGLTEDTTDLQEYHEGKFEAEVEKLRRLRLSRGGRGNVRMRIEGVTA